MAKESGKTNKQAASIAKNLTVNFNKKGEAGTMANALYMFYNASIQGSARLAKQLASSRTTQVLAGTIAATGVGLDMYNRSQNADAYALVPQYIKDTNYVLMNKDGTYEKFPLPYGYNVFKSVGDLASQLAAGEVEASKIPLRILSMTVNAFSPIGVDAQSLSHTVAPTLMKPIIEIETNRNAFGQNIAPNDNPYEANIPDSQNYYKSVNPLAKGLAQGMNSLTGGNAFEKGLVDVSPETIEHLVEFATGALGKLVLNSSTVVSQALDKEKDIDMNKVPFARKFYATPREKAETNIVYQMYKESGDTKFSDLERRRFYKWAGEANAKGDMQPKEARRVQDEFKANQGKIDFARKYNIQDRQEFLNEDVGTKATESGLINGREVYHLKKEAEKNQGVK